ncbi:MAG: hypothetical protein KBT13_09865, partial [Bacteroidales bacterium]|nr:hypothetical protein [Candidatus Sodaliphilus limicaballi]
RSDDVFGGCFGCLVWLYFAISQIMSLVFFIQYCRSDDSLIEIILIDTWVSEIKGLLWIFFIW